MKAYKGLTAQVPGLAMLFIIPLGGAYGIEQQPQADTVQALRDRDPRDEVFYFVLPDRFYNADPSNDRGDNPEGSVLDHGYLPTHKGYYHGGDIRGLTEKLDYLQGLGITAIWMGPIAKNQPVQGDGTIEGSSAAYHGYWITDFTQVDPHLGSGEDLKELVAEAHKRGIKVFFDIITNHTADVIKYRECHDPKVGSENDTEDLTDGEALAAGDCPYRSIADYPFTTLGGPDGKPINEGFDYTQLTQENFERLTDPRYAYSPYLPEGLEDLKRPAWLNNIRYYHNRGDSTFSGENSLYGDFVGLDDLYTANPAVVQGMSDIYKNWISEYQIDGFRVDTVKHVNIEFWQQFTPAILEHARAEEGIPNFFVFGEVYDATPESLSIYTTQGELPAVLDFGFQANARAVVSTGNGTQVLEEFFAKDDYYTDKDSNAYSLPTFIGNHDMGRIGYFINQDNPDASEPEKLARSLLGHALMFFARGMPVIYYGDEQGFTGDGHDQDARQNMFPSQVASYNDDKLLGTERTPADDNFDTAHPLYQGIARFAQIYKEHRALRQGVQVHRYSEDQPGIYAFSRLVPEERIEYIVSLNTATADKTATLATYTANTTFKQVYPAAAADGQDAPTIETDDGGRIKVAVPALDFIIYRADQPIATHGAAPAVALRAPEENEIVSGRIEVRAELKDDGNHYAAVHFAASIDGGEYQTLGVDYEPPYRLFYDATPLANRTKVSFRAVATSLDGQTGNPDSVAVITDARMPEVTVQYENGNHRPSAYALFESGFIVYPQAIAEQPLRFTWNEGDETVFLFYEEPKAHNGNILYQFDQPIRLNLKRDIYPHAVDTADGGLTATVYINDAGQVAGTTNFSADGDDPRTTLPVDVDAPAPVSDTLYIRGGMNTWQATDELSYIGNYTYQLCQELQAGHIEFKFADEDWSDATNIGAPLSAAGLNIGGQSGNLIIYAPGTDGYCFDFFSYPGANSSRYNFYRIEAQSKRE